MSERVLGIIGGTGLYDLPGLSNVQRKAVDTPFGAPSSELVLGELDGRKLAFLSRHGPGHRLSPSEINYRANVWALKAVGVEQILAVSAVGSMKEQIAPGDFVLVDQTIDLTRRRTSTFFEGGAVAHVAFADPICDRMRGLLAPLARENGGTTHERGTYVCIEGPQFSTRAESRLYRSWGVDVIGMTAMPEAKLAREAQLCYGLIALATDYDCWHDAHADVTVAAVIATLAANAARARSLVALAAQRLPDAGDCKCRSALAGAIQTDRAALSLPSRERLALLLGDKRS